MRLHYSLILALICAGSLACASEQSRHAPQQKEVATESETTVVSQNGDGAPKSEEPLRGPASRLGDRDKSEESKPGYVLEERIFDFGKDRQRVLVQGDPEGIPVLLLHGATFRAELWRDLGTLEMLSSSGFLAVAADLPGHGKSGRSGYPVHRHVKELIKTLKLDRPVVLGHSYAGAYLFPLIAKHSTSLRGAVLISPTHIRKYEKKVRGKILPVLVLWGSADELNPVHLANRLVKIFPGSRKVILEEAKHECYEQATDSFHTELLRFLGELE